MKNTAPTNRHQQLFALAIPMILSNITVPLLGLVDTAVLGHLSHAYYLGGATVGAMLITALTWLCGFLRMSSTGLAAQAYGSKDATENLAVLIRGLAVALLLGLLFVLCQGFYLEVGLWLAGGSADIQYHAKVYAQIRIWGLPAALANLVILGWLLGNHQAKKVMWLLIVTNLTNLILDLWFVLGLQWSIAGVARATVIAEYFGFFLGLLMIFQQTQWLTLLKNKVLFHWPTVFALSHLKQFFQLNRDILLRTLCLEICFLFITFQGARLGDEVVATNAILLNFLLLISFGLDGVANAAEALVGEAKGANKPKQLRSVVNLSLFWTAVFAIFYSVIFIVFGEALVRLMTNIETVMVLTNTYIVWLWVMPILACWCYLFDGVYIGLMRAKVMRNSMIISTFLGFFPLWFIFQSLGNHAIWLAFSIFMLIRGATLAWHYYYRIIKQEMSI